MIDSGMGVSESLAWHAVNSRDWQFPYIGSVSQLRSRTKKGSEHFVRCLFSFDRLLSRWLLFIHID
ncbi:hypothetical protein FHS27_002605 [Rhodopirellula rubra]|uniref:Uncharacterized protein n=1 Tax=Aporhodopirellula rubra TaxID=980271 RepID=A0A7W5DYE9_9BACT|nr:hypothetical protein [Aporhodopirellula rubra]